MEITTLPEALTALIRIEIHWHYRIRSSAWEDNIETFATTLANSYGDIPYCELCTMYTGRLYEDKERNEENCLTCLDFNHPVLESANKAFQGKLRSPGPVKWN